MQIEVADIRADEGRTSVTDLGVHVRAVHIDKSAVVVDNLTHLADSGLEDAVGRWVRDHTARKTVFVLLGLGAPVRHVGVT